jgi:transcriptional regulator with XRE-family HTH domain
MSRPTPQQKVLKAPSLPALCQAVKAVRMAYQESQATFAQRVGLTAMTVSKFERGETVPRDPAVLQALSHAAEEVNLNIEAQQFATACRDVLNVECVNRVNRTYPGPLISAAQPSLTIPFQTLPEWRLATIALYAVRYAPTEAAAIEAASGAVRSVVDEALKRADSSRGIGADFFRELEARIKALMDERSLKQIPGTTDDEEGR